jgi:K+-sensing histidine kinase KdpD
LIQNTIQEANRLNSLCNNLLLASQIEAGNYSITKEAINLSQLVNRLLSTILKTASRNEPSTAAWKRI